jgi:hypothetical protein
VQTQIRGKKKGIVFLPFEFRVGVDIKFGKDAYVSILHLDKNRLDSETIKQMIGRGSRAQGAYQGDLWCDGDTKLRAAILK